MITETLAISPVARIHGEPLMELPRDLYIPPDALAVVLETFEGPLDLLLYLIRRHNLDVLDIPMAELCRQYMDYIEAIRTHQLELAAEYLVMAAVLIEIKSRMLLPRSPAAVEEEADPRAELMRRLLEYERMKLAAQKLDGLPQAGRDFTVAQVHLEQLAARHMPKVNAEDLQRAWIGLINRARVNRHHVVAREELSVREHMSRILRRLRQQGFVEFTELFNPASGIPEVVVAFLALLELTRESLIDVSQTTAYEPIYVKLSHAESAPIHDA